MKNTLSLIVLSTMCPLIGCETPQTTTPKTVVVTTSATAANTATLWVNGIGCPGCIPSVEEPMMKLAGVEKVTVELQTGVVTVVLNDASSVTEEQLECAIEDGGFTLTKIEMPQ